MMQHFPFPTSPQTHKFNSDHKNSCHIIRNQKKSRATEEEKNSSSFLNSKMCKMSRMKLKQQYYAFSESRKKKLFFLHAFLCKTSVHKRILRLMKKKLSNFKLKYLVRTFLTSSYRIVKNITTKGEGDKMSNERGAV